MSCDRFRPEILESALGGPLTAEGTRHLSDCAGCRSALDRESVLASRIDDELRLALAVDPTPRLLPRVREEISRPPARSFFWTMRWLALAALAGLALLAIPRLVRAPSPSPPTRDVARAYPAEPPVSRPPPAVTSPSAAGAPTAAGTRPPVPALVLRQSPAARLVGEPEVLVPPGQEAALARLMANLRGRCVEAGPLAVAFAATPRIEDMQIVPLEIQPLAEEPHN